VCTYIDIHRQRLSPSALWAHAWCLSIDYALWLFIVFLADWIRAARRMGGADGAGRCAAVDDGLLDEGKVSTTSELRKSESSITHAVLVGGGRRRDVLIANRAYFEFNLSKCVL